MIFTKIKSAALSIVLLMVVSCSETPKIDNFEKNEWMQYRMGCTIGRLAIADQILTNKNTWLGLDDDVIVELLGNPERSYYYERNVRAFAYYLKNGKQCDTTISTFGDRLILEFNATGYVKRIFIEKDI